MGRHLAALAVLALTMVMACSSGMAVTSDWQRVTMAPVLTSLASFRARSSVECVAVCSRFSHCRQAAFQRSTLTCFLQPTSDATASGELLPWYENRDVCSPDDADVANALSVSWRHSLTSLEGDVSCDVQYMSSEGGVTTTCDVSNTWSVSGQCLRKLWINTVGTK